MILLVVATMALLGGTTWLALQQSIARDPVLNRQLTAVGLLLCMLTVVSAVVAASGVHLVRVQPW
jgi:hypothetical protein